MGVLEHLPSKLMTELQMKTQKKLMKMGKGKVEAKPVETPSPRRKVVVDCLTVELITHVFPVANLETRQRRIGCTLDNPPADSQDALPILGPRGYFQKIWLNRRRIINHQSTWQVN